MVAKNELFEQHGDRVSESPLSDDAWNTPQSAEEEADDDDPEDADTKPACEAADLAALTAVLNGNDRAALVIHWATWCDACVEEIPSLVELHERIGSQVEFIGVSWDAFMGEQDAANAKGEVQRFAREHALIWNQWLVDAAPDDFFGHFDMDCKEVPQAWLVDADGSVLHRVEGVVGRDAMKDLERRVEAL